MQRLKQATTSDNALCAHAALGRVRQAEWHRDAASQPGTPRGFHVVPPGRRIDGHTRPREVACLPPGWSCQEI